MQADDRRSQLMEAALRAFSRGGYHDTHVSHIIGEAGVARGTFYLYFKSKREVFQALIDEMFASLDGVVHALDPGALQPPIDQIRRNLERFVGVLRARPALTRLLLEQGVPLEPDVRARLRGFYSDLTERMEAALDAGTRLGLIRNVDREMVACALVGAVKEVFHEREPETLDPARVADALVDLALHGLLQTA